MFSCSQQPVDVKNTDALPPIFPDYVGVTIPADIAPLNFNVDGAEYVCVVAKGSLGGELTASGEWADFDIDGWHSLTRQNVGGTIAVSVTAKTDGGKWIGYRDFEINVSGDPLDEYGLTYRKIAPGYETFSNIGIYQRDIHTFDEDAIVSQLLVLCGAILGVKASYDVKFRKFQAELDQVIENEKQHTN